MPIDNKTLLRVRSIVGAGGGGEGGDAVIRSLSVTENGTYTAPSGVDGYSPVTVNVPEPAGTKTITSNGTHDVKDYASAQVNVPDVPAVTEALTVTENGTYTPDSGVDGFDAVTVNVAGSGGGVYVETVTFAETSHVWTIHHNLGKVPNSVIVLFEGDGTLEQDHALLIHSNRDMGFRILVDANSSISSVSAKAYVNVVTWGINKGEFVTANESIAVISLPSATMSFPAGKMYRAFVEVGA